MGPAPGMPSPWSARGGVGMTPALTFNRTNDVAVNPSGSLDNLGSHLSLSAWVNPTLLVVFDTVLMKSNGNWGSGYGIYAQNANEICAFANGWGNHICAPIFPDGHLHHVVLTYDGTTLALYIDNIESTTPVAYVASLSADTLYIGYGNGQNHTWSFEGVIDEVRVSVIATTPAGVITRWNRHAEDLFGWPAEAGEASMSETMTIRRAQGGCCCLDMISRLAPDRFCVKGLLAQPIPCS